MQPRPKPAGWAGTAMLRLDMAGLMRAGMESSVPGNNYGVIHQCPDQRHGRESQFRQSNCGQVERKDNSFGVSTPVMRASMAAACAMAQGEGERWARQGA